MLVGLIQSAEGLKKKTDSHKQEEILPTDCRLTQAASTLPWISNLTAIPADSGLGQPPQAYI